MSVLNQAQSSTPQSRVLRQLIQDNGTVDHSPLVVTEVTAATDPTTGGIMSGVKGLTVRDQQLIAIGIIEGREAAAKVADKWFKNGHAVCRQVSQEIRKG